MKDTLSHTWLSTICIIYTQKLRSYWWQQQHNEMHNYLPVHRETARLVQYHPADCAQQVPTVMVARFRITAVTQVSVHAHIPPCPPPNLAIVFNGQCISMPISTEIHLPEAEFEPHPWAHASLWWGLIMTTRHRQSSYMVSQKWCPMLAWVTVKRVGHLVWDTIHTTGNFHKCHTSHAETRQLADDVNV